MPKFPALSLSQTIKPKPKSNSRTKKYIQDLITELKGKSKF